MEFKLNSVINKMHPKVLYLANHTCLNMSIRVQPNYGRLILMPIRIKIYFLLAVVESTAKVISKIRDARNNMVCAPLICCHRNQSIAPNHSINTSVGSGSNYRRLHNRFKSLHISIATYKQVDTEYTKGCYNGKVLLLSLSKTPILVKG